MTQSTREYFVCLAGHCWRSRDELIRDVLLWIPTHGRAKAGRPARTYIQQLCEDTGCCPEDLPRAMNDREEWRERVRDIRAASTIWWWWWSIYLAQSARAVEHTASLQRGKAASSKKGAGYDIKLSDSDAPTLEIWGMWCTPSLSMLPGPLCLGVVELRGSYLWIK